MRCTLLLKFALCLPQAVKADLLKEPRAALHALVMHVWPKAGPAASWQLSLLLSFLQDCLTALVGCQFTRDPHLVTRNCAPLTDSYHSIWAGVFHCLIVVRLFHRMLTRREASTWLQRRSSSNAVLGRPQQ